MVIAPDHNMPLYYIQLMIQFSMCHVFYVSILNRFIHVYYKEMKQQFELNEKIEREKNNMKQLKDDEISKVSAQLENERSAIMADHDKLVIC